MTTMTTTEALPDAGPCRWCPHLQWSHKRGKGGCRELDCTCDKYAVDPAAVQPVDLTTDPASEVPGELCPCSSDPTAACTPAPLVDPSVSLTHAEALALDEAERLRDQLAEVREQAKDSAYAASQAREGVKQLARERAEFEVQRDQAYERVDELDTELGRIHAALGIAPDRDAVEVIEDRRVRLRDAESDLLDVRGILSPNGYPRRVPVDLVPTVAPAVKWLADRVDELAAEREHMELNPTGTAEWLKNRVNELTAELGRITTERDEARRLADLTAKDQASTAANLDDTRRAHAEELARLTAELERATLAGPVPATAVLYQYDADQCTTAGCGSRYTVPVDHEHPLTPVTVLVVAREVPDA